MELFRFIDESINLEPSKMDTLSLAFLGDSIHSFFVRRNLVISKDYKQKDLQALSAKIVCAKNQSKAFDLIKTDLNEEEQNLAKRARNAKTNNVAKNATIEEYKKSTAFEALVGFAYLSKKFDRMSTFLQVAESCVNQGE